MVDLPDFDSMPDESQAKLPDFDSMPDESQRPQPGAASGQTMHQVEAAARRSLAGGQPDQAAWGHDVLNVPREEDPHQKPGGLAGEWGQAVLGAGEGAAGSVAGGMLGDIEGTARQLAHTFDKNVSTDTTIPTSTEGGYLGKKGLDLIDPSANEDRATGAMVGSMLTAGKILPKLAPPAAKVARTVANRFVNLDEPPPPPPPGAPSNALPKVVDLRRPRTDPQGVPTSPPLLPPEASSANLPKTASVGAETASPLEGLAPEAIQQVHGALKEAGFTPYTLEQRLGEMSPHQFAFETSDPLWNSAEGIHIDGGQGGMDLRQANAQRLKEAPQRVTQILDNGIGAKEDLSMLARIERIDQQKAADPLYQKFRDLKITPTPAIKDVMQDLQNVPGIFSTARRLAQLRRVPFDENFFTTGPQKAFPSAQSWDMVKQALDDKIGRTYRAVEGDPVPRPTVWTREYTKIRNKLVDAIDNHPDQNIAGVWKDARSTYAAPEQIRTARDLGSRLLNESIDPNELPFLTATYNGPQMAAARQGLRNYLGNLMGRQGNATTNTVEKLLGPNAQSKVRWVLGDQEANQLIKDLEAEKNMRNSSQLMNGNSRTAKRTVNREIWQPDKQGFVGKALNIGHAILHPHTGIPKLAAEHGVKWWDARQAAKAATIRDDASKIYLMQGPQRDAVLQWILEHGGNYGGETPPTPVQQTVPFARGGAVPQRDEGGPVGTAGEEQVEPPPMPGPAMTQRPVLDPMAPGLHLLGAPGMGARMAEPYTAPKTIAPTPAAGEASQPTPKGSTIGAEAPRSSDEGTSGRDVGTRGVDEAPRTAAPPVDDAARAKAVADAETVAGGRTPLIGLPQEHIVSAGQYKPGPIGYLHDIAEQYMRDADLPYNPPRTYAQVDPARAKRIANEFDNMKHDPQDPAVQASYNAMIDETLAQFNAIKQAGIKFDFIRPDMPDPYAANPRLAAKDVGENKHLWVFPTSSGFGSDEAVAQAVKDNPLLRPVNEYINGQQMTANDVFRIVHDIFGHLKDGNGFRATGEENAWRSHSAMYSDLARPAMTSETRGQNSWVNYGPHGDTNRNATAADTTYADQKIGLLPDWVMSEGRNDVQPDVTGVHKQLADSIPGLSGAMKYMTPDEIARVKKQNGDQIAKVFSGFNPEEMASVAYSGRAKRGWYRDSAQALVDTFGIEDAPRFAALLASMSPQSSVESNATNALNTWVNWNRAGRPTDRASIVKIMGQSVQGKGSADSALPAWINNTVASLSHPMPENLQLSGPKVTAFSRNLRGHVNDVTLDAWMSNYANMDPSVISAARIKATDPANQVTGKKDMTGVKGPGYIGMAAAVRNAADVLTKRTGEQWTPAEVQETIWSWAKTLYEKADAAGKDSRIADILKAGDLTHEQVASTPDFAKLFVSNIYRKILEEGGYGPQLEALERNQKSAGSPPLEGSVLGAKGSGFSQPTFEAHLQRAAKRLEEVRQRRADEARTVAPEAPSSLMSEEDWGAGFAQGGAIDVPGRAWGGAVNRPAGGAVEDDSEPLPGTPSPFSVISSRPVLQMGVGPGFPGAQAPGAAPAPEPEPAAPAEPAQPFYSAVQKAVQDAPQNAATPERWQNYLKGQPDVKPEELDWVGTPEAGSDGRISKADMLQHLQDSKLQLGEVEHTSGGLPDDIAEYEAGPTQEVANGSRTPLRHPNLPEGVSLEAIHDGNGQPIGFNITGNIPRDHRRFFDNWQDAHEYLGGEGNKNAPMYPDATLPGGKNYRELILTLPQKTDWRVAPSQDYPDEWHVLDGTGRERYTGHKEDADAYLQDELSRGEAAPVYKHSHWPDVTNPLVHMRMNDRDIPDVGKTLFMEELQSDWHQAGRKNGYRTDPNQLPEGYKVEARPPFGHSVIGPNGAIVAQGDTPTQAIANARGLVGRMPNQPPDAPFKNTADWVKLGLKRMITKAAQEGYDAIAWTPGDVQNKRNNLSEHVDDLSWNKDTGELRGFKDEDQVATQLGLDEKQLSDYVGKEVADRLINNPTTKNTYSDGTWHRLQGKDLEVGGKGMRKFYDELLPSVANKLGKKYGAQVENKTLSYQKPTDWMPGEDAMEIMYGHPNWTDIPPQDADYHPQTGSTGPRAQWFRSLRAPRREQLLQQARVAASKDETVPVPVLRLTPKLIEAAKTNGFPQFARGGAVRGEQEAFSSSGANHATAMSGSAFARGGSIDATHDVVSGADSTSHHVEVDRHIPAKFRKYLAAHELAEAQGMKEGMSYGKAHSKRGIPAENAALDADGVDRAKYNEEIAGLLSHIEHEKVTRPPTGHLHVRPEDAIKRARGGRVDPQAIDKSPSGPQKVAGNYAKDHVSFFGLNISLENAKGSRRSGVSKNGVKWSSVLPAHYGYLRGTTGSDGDHLDVYLGPHLRSPKVWVVDQVDADTKGFDEHKAFLGFGSKAQVVKTYSAAFSDGKAMERLGAIHELSIEDFKTWLKRGNTTQPLKKNSIVPSKAGKITRSAFLYLSPKPPKNQFAQCSSCSLFTGTGCLIHGRSIKVTPSMSCGFYLHGKPQLSARGQEKEVVTPEQSGLIDTKVRCENCMYTSGNTGNEGCGLFRMLNQRQPEDFDLDPEIDRHGCCNAFRTRE